MVADERSGTNRVHAKQKAEIAFGLIRQVSYRTRTSEQYLSLLLTSEQYNDLSTYGHLNSLDWRLTKPHILFAPLTTDII